MFGSFEEEWHRQAENIETKHLNFIKKAMQIT